MFKLSFLMLFGITTSLYSQKANENLNGNWYAEELSKSTINFYQNKNGIFFGKIIKSDEKDKIGRIPFENFTFNKNTGLYTGTIQSARSFFTLDGEIRFVDSKTIKIKGTRLFMTKTFTLKKL